MDSLITDLKNPIGGCYESSTITNSWTTTGNSSYYALGGGGPTKGQTWIYETSAVRVLAAFLLCFPPSKSNPSRSVVVALNTRRRVLRLE